MLVLRVKSAIRSAASRLPRPVRELAVMQPWVRRTLSVIAIVAITVPLLLVAHTTRAAGWWNNSWSYAKTITFSNASSSAALTNFPVRVQLTTSNFNYAQAQSLGQDIRFIDADNSTVLSYEIEYWNTSGTSELWVKVPQVDASNTDYIYMYYGNSGATDAQAKTSVWNGFNAEYHMSESPVATAPQFKDGSPNAQNLSVDTGYAAMASGDQLPGQIDGSVQFRSTSQAKATDSTYFSPTTDFSISAWVKFSVAANQNIVYKNHGGAPYNSFLLQTDASAKPKFQATNASSVQSTALGSTAVSTGTWYLFTGVRTGTTLNVYLNGALAGTTTISGNNYDSNSDFLVGGIYGTHDTVQIDETRMSGVARNADWVAADYKSGANTFNTIAQYNPVTMTQSSYRWYGGSNALTPGGAYAAQNTAATASCSVGPLRLRMGVGSGGGATAASSRQFKLQYGTSTGGPWADVGGNSGWYNSSWQYRRKITFNNTASSEALSNFSVRIALTTSNFTYANAQSAGQDIRFTDEDGTTILPYEIEKWTSGGTSDVWVKVPQIAASSNTDYIYLYYGNAGASDAQNKNSVWTDNYGGVFHLTESPTGAAPQFKDATANNNHSTRNSSTTWSAADQVAGQVGNAVNISNDELTNSTDGPSLSPTGDFTLSLWVKPATLADNIYIWKNNNAAPYWSWYMGMTSAGKFTFSVHDASGNDVYATVTASAAATAGQWYYLEGVKKNGVVSMYINGAQATVTTSGTATSAATFDSDSDFTIGADYQVRPAKVIDEVRLAATARSAAWIQADYKSNANTFTSSSAEQPYSAGSPVWAYYDTPGAADGATLASTALSGSTAAESYVESGLTPLNPNAIASGGVGEWDFSVLPSGISVNTTYYFRMADALGSPLDAYSTYPQITITTQPSVDIVMRHGDYFEAESKKGFSCASIN